MITIKTEEAREDIEGALIGNASNECSRRIFEQYPAQRQMNLVIAAAASNGDAEAVAAVAEMESFIKSFKDKYHSLVEKIQKTDFDYLQKIDVTLNEHWS